LKLLQFLVQTHEVASVKYSAPRYVWDAPRDCLNLWLEVHFARGEVFPGGGVGLATAVRMAMAAALNYPALP
jgi:hypothetical protein